MFVAVLQLTLVLHVRNTVVDAASEGARFGALAGRDAGDAAARARLLIDASLSSAYAADVSASTVVVDGVQTVVVKVHSPLPVVGLLGPGLLHVDGHAVDEDAL